MTVNVKMDRMKCITSKKSVGKNVAIVLRNQCAGLVPMRLYEPNDVINMIGIRIETAKNRYQRFFTAHMKQMSTNDRESILNQFEEIKLQFHLADTCKEGMLIVCDANVHVGPAIPGCKDKRDWAGEILMKLIENESLYLLNREDLCRGVVTRVDPSNGSKSTLDLAICNEYMIDSMIEMVIDEEGEYKPTKYVGKKVTRTDHNTIFLKMEIEKVKISKSQPYFNTRCEIGKANFQSILSKENVNDLFIDGDDINEDYRKLMKIWDDTIQKSFKKVTRSSKSIRGVDEHIKNLMHEERRIKKEYHKEQNKSGKLEQIRKEISERLTENMEKEMQKKVEEISGSKCPQAEVFKIRRQMTKTENLDFPLKDEKGNIRVTAEGIDEVINKHFEKVFDQNPVEEGWEVYWEYVSKIYEIISSKEISDDEIQEPTYEEISSIIDKLDRTKAVQGIMTIDLLKNASTNIRRAIYRCVRLCHLRNNMPDKFRIEKMVLLYKHKGKLDELDNYRGIFLRMIIVSIYQKWLCSKCAPIVDEH